MSKPSLVNKRLSEQYPHDYIEDRIKKVISILKPQPEARYLDIGCSNGKVTRKISQKLKANKTFGVDIANVADAKKRGIEAYEIDLNEDERLPFKSESFDVITCLDTLEHVYNTDFLISEITRLLSDDGQAIISVPRTDSLVNIFLLLLGYQMMSGSCSLEKHYGGFSENRTSGHMAHFTKKALFEICQAHGLDIISYHEASFAGAWLADQKVVTGVVGWKKQLIANLIRKIPFKKEISIVVVKKKGEFDEKLIKATIQEGVGSVYERFRLIELFEKLSKKYKFNSVLEFDDHYTRGFENNVFLKAGKKVNVLTRRKASPWPWKKKKPNFIKNKPRQKFDLVWNFALLPRTPGLLEEMKNLSKKYVMFFCPNYLNWGTPFHEAYHIASRTKCTHAERGSVKGRIAYFVRKKLEKRGIKIIESGYVDMPVWPDTGASMIEVKENILKMKVGTNNKKRGEIDLSQIVPKLNPSFIEKSKNKVLKTIFSHHFYFFLKIK